MHLSTATLFAYLLTYDPSSKIVVQADFNGLRNPSRSRRRNTQQQQQRNLQVCAGRKSKDCNNGCEWIKGNCEDATPPGPPTTSSPTPANVSGPPPAPGPSDGCGDITKAKDCNNAGCSWGGGQVGCMAPPTNSPTTSPTKFPTRAPVTPNPTTSPTSSSPPTTTLAPTESNVATYIPGDLTVSCDGLTLSTGMACKKLTTAGQNLLLADGTQSSATMHGTADGAGVISHLTDGGWYYASNSENGSGGGGVGVLRFASNGDLVGYERTLTGTSRNCGGGVTAWGTWVSCEENGSSGRCHEVDPHTGNTQQVNVVDEGGNYESFAYDDQDPDMTQYTYGARFFTTEDASNGALIRYTPHPNAFGTGNTADILTTANGVYEYLVLNADMTFTWSESRTAGESSASNYFPYAEGIDVNDRILNFVSKTEKRLLTLDLANETWSQSSTQSGAFNLQPDQLARMINDDEVLYFAEDGGSNCDIHGRDSTGRYFTIVTGDSYSTETTGLAFSPDSLYMYVAFQGNSNVYSFWRTDGLPFDGRVASTKYH